MCTFHLLVTHYSSLLHPFFFRLFSPNNNNTTTTTTMHGGRNNSGRGDGGESSSGGRGRARGGGGRGWVPPSIVSPRPQVQAGLVPPPLQQMMTHTQTGPWGPHALPPPDRPPAPSPIQPDSPQKPIDDDLGSQDLNVSEEELIEKKLDTKKPLEIMKRPDGGGKSSTGTLNLLANHFRVRFNPNNTLFQYGVDVKTVDGVKITLGESELRSIKDMLFSNHVDDRLTTAVGLRTAYDGGSNLFSAVPLPTGNYRVDVPEGEEAMSGSYLVTITFQNEVKLSELQEYMRGNLCYVPLDILHGMDVVMNENPSRTRIGVKRSFYSMTRDLGHGIAAYSGFRHSLKPTSQGLALCLDYSVLPFRKPCPVIEFLEEHINGFGGVGDIKRLRQEVNSALQGLKVRVIHRLTKQKFTIAGLTDDDARNTYFDIADPEGNSPPQTTSILAYFKDKWGRDLLYPNIPCLELGKLNKSNIVPMELCELVEGQRFPKENLDGDSARDLKDMMLAEPAVRRDTVNQMMQAGDGPCGNVSRNFGMLVNNTMTTVVGRVIGAPELKLGASCSVKVNAKSQWNLVGKSLAVAKSVNHRWALLDFTDGEHCNNKLQANAFIHNLRGCCEHLGIKMDEPIVRRTSRMDALSSIDGLENLFKSVVEESRRKKTEKLQMIICVTSERDVRYKNLKFVSETRIGVVTQCCLSTHANTAVNEYLTSLCLKINAKLGGSNFELLGYFARFRPQDHVMFIGAHVNHPAFKNTSCPSIAAVVGTVNWPALNRYAARVRPQAHGCEKIIDFGAMCLDLVKAYARINKVRPKKIIVFRDGVSEGQFEMVLRDELRDLKNSINSENYEPAITVVVAQKRHQTRLFVEDKIGSLRSENVPPGTVVDTFIVHPHDFDFYLCSHYGSIGTSKPTHYYVLCDENEFSSDELQKLIYDMCFTFVRCTKSVSLVPPIYYADLVAYRGRMYQEVLMEMHSKASSSEGASFNPSLYRLHPDLENVMFFV